PLSAERVNVELKRRMGGYGRGARMKIEADQIEWLAGVRAGETLGSPIAMLVWNRDWEHWQDVMAPEADAPGSERRRQVTRALPGRRRRDGDDRPHRRGQGGGRHAGRRGRGDRAGPSSGARLPRLVGREAGRAAGTSAHVHPGGEGGGAGARLRGRAA